MNFENFQNPEKLQIVNFTIREDGMIRLWLAQLEDIRI